KTELFNVCKELMESGFQEEFIIASAWAFKRRKEFSMSDFKIFESWIKKYISNWATCDDFCTKSLGHLLLDFPALVPKIKPWTGSKNKWLRRALAVSLIIPVRNKKNLDDIFDVSIKLMKDPEDLVQKAYGWALKEASNKYPKEVFDFVIKHKAQMTRTALRYAIEKMPKEWKKKTMKI
ncbi:MAG: DNA alkylation repair protein, partial [Patescibacteria group bacterium]